MYGTLTVIKDMGLKEPYVGQIPLVSGEVAEDITQYYATSEQIPTVCALGVLVAPDLSVLCAGGYLLQLLPGATEQEITILENNIAKMKSVTEMLSEGMTLEDMMECAMEGFSPNILDESVTSYVCDCSEERIERALLSLGKQELESLAKEQPEAEVCCQFCDKVRKFDISTLLEKL